MRTATVAEIRDALDEVLAAVPECKSVSLVGGNYTEGSERFSVRVLVGEMNPQNEERLNELLSAEGPVCELIEADPTLGHVVSAATVRSHTGHRAFRQPGDPTDQLGSELLVELYR